MKNALIVFTKGFVLGLVAFNMGFALWGCGEESSPSGEGGNGGGESRPCQNDEKNPNTGYPCRFDTCRARGGGGGGGGSPICQTDKDCDMGDPCRFDTCDAVTHTCGAFTEFSCPSDANCDGQVDEVGPNNPRSCGESRRDCIIALGRLSSCVDGQCVCEEGKTDCPDPEGGRRCVDTSCDIKNCGECGNNCPDRSPCTNGECRACEDGKAVCSYHLGCGTAIAEECVDTSSDIWHCGECGNQCDAGTSCRNGECR